MKHILLTAGLGAILAIASSSGDAHAQSCDRDGYDSGYDSGYTTPVYNTPVYNQPVYNNDYRYNQPVYNDRRQDKRQLRRLVRRMFLNSDYNRDGYISRREARSSRILRRKFFRIDRNRDGYITRNEMRRHFKRQQRLRRI